MNFSTRLRSLMEENNLNQTELSKQCNICQTSISGWLKGHHPLPTALKTLSIFFGVSTDYLLGYTDKKYTIENKEINEEEKQIIEKYNKASEDTKTAIKRILNLA